MTLSGTYLKLSMEIEKKLSDKIGELTNLQILAIKYGAMELLRPTDLILYMQEYILPRKYSFNPDFQNFSDLTANRNISVKVYDRESGEIHIKIDIPKEIEEWIVALREGRSQLT